MITVSSEDIEYLEKSRSDFLEQLKIKNNDLLFGVGDLVVEVIKPLSKGTVVENKTDFLLEILAYVAGVEYVTLNKLSILKFDTDIKATKYKAFLDIRSALGYGTIKINKKLLKTLMYYKDQAESMNCLSDWCHDEANRIQRKYQIPIDALQKLPEAIYEIILEFLKDKQTLTNGEEMYIAFLNDSIDIALTRFSEDLGLIPITLYSLRAKTPKGIKNTYCRYCHNSINRGDAGDYCTKRGNRVCFEQNVGSRTKRKSTNELVFINTKDKVCVSCGIPLEYNVCRIVGDKLLCKKPQCYERLKYKSKKLKR
ncbi:hypothetical protein C4561_00795 [candidate division WWE3 bacterium]|jgi:hypothetical protein|uniref:Uncharacterized protein n=1 Tax=candidate division WWE3 bacterium TaxID=2053526 RepID=A0A3A4ZG99_UNCKA|nr:MAG: hypothetical protein C4561_00795 [candidate division WWE3 bacterium]